MKYLVFKILLTVGYPVPVGSGTNVLLHVFYMQWDKCIPTACSMIKHELQPLNKSK